MIANSGESKNLGYWYKGSGTGSSNGLLPPQLLSSKQKTPRWKEANMDALERIGIVQTRQNLRFKDFYRMVEGKMAYSELSEVIPQLRELEEVLDDMEIPTYIKHYDLVGIIVNGLVGEYMRNSDKFNVDNVDEIATTEYEREKQDLITKYLKESFEKELNRRLIQQGINPDPNSLDLQDPNKVQEYLQAIQQKKEEMTPREIQEFMDTKWRTKASIWGEHTLEADRERFYMDELDRDELIDFLLTGRCFRHFRIGYDYYKPERWSPLNTFFSQDLDTKYIQDGEYAGRVHFYTPNQVFTKYGHLLSSDDKKKLLRGNTYYENNTGSNSGSNNSVKNIFSNNFGETHIVPHKQYYDYEFMLDIQDEFGIPVGQRQVMDKEGNTETLATFLPSSNGIAGSQESLVHKLRDDLVLRTDLLQVTEAYWMSYRKIGYINYLTSSGALTQDIVTDELISDFLKENNITQLNSVTLEEVENDPKPNTIVWDYIPEVWKGVKINEKNANNSQAIYIDIAPLEVQIKGDSNVYDIKLPVAGLVDTSLALKIQPFQVGHNVSMNQAYNLLEKEIGLFFIFDINFLPSEFKKWGDTEETLVHFTNLIKDTGMFPVDMSKQNVRDGGGFNQMTSQDMSYGAKILEKFAIAGNYKNLAFEQVGLNPQRLGTPIEYQTAEGVKTSQDASYAQTEIYFDRFSSYKKRMLEMHLSVAQYAQKENKDISVFYTKSDSSKAYLKFTDPYFQLRKIGILPVSNSKKRKELETFKASLLQNNTMAGDEMAIAKLITSDTMVELIEVARNERLRQEKQVQITQQNTLEQIEKQAEIDEKKEVSKWQREEYSKEQDRLNKIELERIEALGRAIDNDADTSKLDFINKNADIALKNEKLNSDINIAEKEHTRKTKKDEQDFKLNMQKLKNDVLKIQASRKNSKDDKYIAEINP